VRSPLDGRSGSCGCARRLHDLDIRTARLERRLGLAADNAAQLQQHGAADGREDHCRNELVARADAEEVRLRAARDQIGS